MSKFTKKCMAIPMRVPWCQLFSCEIRKWNLNFQFRFSFTHVIGKRNLRFHFFVFRFPNTMIMEFEPSVRFLFSHDFGQQNSKSFPFFIFRFGEILKHEIWSSIFVFRLCVSITSVFYLNRKNEGTSCQKHKAWKPRMMSAIFLWRKIIATKTFSW